MYTDNEILFPHYAIPSLKNIRGKEWAQLVEMIMKKTEHDVETLAFMLMMIRLNGCLPCETDSYRAMRGCTACAHQTLRRFKGKDAELVKMYEAALEDMRTYATKHPQQPINISSEQPLQP